MSERQAFTVFYSWQSDLKGSANRSLIEDALEKAAKTLRSDDSLRVEPVMDRDTAGKSGSPDIAATIFEKIDAADAFVADVSFITPATTPETESTRKRCPNPNVLLELGYALHRHGWQRVLLVFNEHYGSVNDLPFDLRGRRVITYTSAPEGGDRATPRKVLQGRFVDDLRTLVNQTLPKRALAFRPVLQLVPYLILLDSIYQLEVVLFVQNAGKKPVANGFNVEIVRSVNDQTDPPLSKHHPGILRPDVTPVWEYGAAAVWVHIFRYDLSPPKRVTYRWHIVCEEGVFPSEDEDGLITVEPDETGGYKPKSEIVPREKRA